MNQSDTLETQHKTPTNLKKNYKLHWCLYDWARTVWAVLIITFVFPHYFTQNVAPTPEEGKIMWGVALSIIGVLIGLISPIMGAISDTLKNGMTWLRLFTTINILCAALLWFILPDSSYAIYALTLVICGTVSFEVAGVFYNSLLITICKPDEVSKVSGIGWGMGYFAGIICLGLCLFFFINTDTPILGLTKENNMENVRIIGPVIALWYLIFSFPQLIMPELEKKNKEPRNGSTIKLAYKQFIESIIKSKNTPYIFYFLIYRMIYTDGINTLFAFAGIYAANTFKMGIAEMMTFGIACNICAGLGALICGWVDSQIGEVKSIKGSLIFIIISSTCILLVNDIRFFWVAALFSTIFVGPLQASSRSLMAKICPEESKGEFFGLYALSGKITSFLGPFVLTILTQLTGSEKIGMSSIIAFFIVGLIGMYLIEIPKDVIFKPCLKANSDKHE